MAKEPTYITPYVYTIENVAIRPGEVFEAINAAIENCGLPDIHVSTVDITEEFSLIGKSKKRVHLRVGFDHSTAFQTYVAHYADRWTIIATRRFVNHTYNPVDRDLKSEKGSYLRQDIQNLRSKVVEETIIGAIKQFLQDKGQRPTYTEEAEEIKVENVVE